MLEAPEALFLANQITEILSNKRITFVMVNQTPHKFTFYSRDIEKHAELLVGKKIQSACARGGMLEIQIEDMILVFTDGANLKFYEPGAKLPSKHQLLIGFDDESCLTVSIRMYGGIFCLAENWENHPQQYFKGSLHTYYQIAKNKPQVLSNQFDRNYFLSLVHQQEMQNKSCKAFLATEQTIPGLGNGVLQDILYQAGIHPKLKVKELTDPQKNRLFDCIKSTLSDMYQRQGRNTETDLLGRKGKYIPYLSKDTAGSFCVRCEDVIRKENYLGGSIYYCSSCQPYSKH